MAEVAFLCVCLVVGLCVCVCVYNPLWDWGCSPRVGFWHIFVAA